MEDFENQLQRKPEPSEMVKESVLEFKDLDFRRRSPETVFKPPFAALWGNSGVVSKKEKQELDSCRCSMKSVTKVNP
jgi:hypothetical protein